MLRWWVGAGLYRPRGRDVAFTLRVMGSRGGCVSRRGLASDFRFLEVPGAAVGAGPIGQK